MTEEHLARWLCKHMAVLENAGNREHWRKLAKEAAEELKSK